MYNKTKKKNEKLVRVNSSCVLGQGTSFLNIPGGSFLLSAIVQQALGRAPHLHQVHPPPVFLSASHEA